MLNREFFLDKIEKSFQVHRIVGILGPRQCGKTTLAKHLFGAEIKKSHFFDLEDPLALERLRTPMLTLEQLEDGLIIIDEIQRRPELFPILRVLHDNYPGKRFLILGSASRDLLQQSSESLAGRIGYVELVPFTASEVDDVKKLWLRGGFPQAFLATSEQNSFAWRIAYIKTFLERDIPALGFQVSAAAMHRFWQMLGHYHGQIFNASQLANALDVNAKTIKHHLDILSGTLMVRVLQPWFENVSKRQVKSPKIYFRDSGLLHALAGIVNMEELLVHPKIGSSWEGFVIENILSKIDPYGAYFWSTFSGAELDLFFLDKGRRIGIEVKYTDQPRLTKSMQEAMATLKLDELTLVYPGNIDFPLAKNIWARGFLNFLAQH